MPRTRFVVGMNLELVTPLHVGTGGWRTVGSVRGKDGSNTPPQVAAMARAHDDQGVSKPYIPGSTLKGALRRLAEQLSWSEPTIMTLFGAPKNDGSGVMGGVIFRGALLSKAADAKLMPYADKTGVDDLGAGVFVAARTCIDRATGTAADNRLYFQEMVAPGSVFAVQMLIEAASNETAESCASELLALLRYVEAHGLRIGKSTADGNGLLKASGITCTRYQVDAKTGAYVPVGALSLPSTIPAAVAHKWISTLNLYCRGPFLIVDSSFVPPEKSDDDKPKGPQLKAQRVRQNMPLLLGSSVSGALRARAEWLMAMDAARGGKLRSVPLDPPIVRSQADVAKVDVVQRLFGVTGFQALLQITGLTLDPLPSRLDITSVKIDRFSGAPIDGALFKCEAYSGVTLKLSLALVGRGGIANGDDEKFVQRLVADIRNNGLEIGHGGNKGFGWFELREAAHA